MRLSALAVAVSLALGAGMLTGCDRQDGDRAVSQDAPARAPSSSAGSTTPSSPSGSTSGSASVSTTPSTPSSSASSSADATKKDSASASSASGSSSSAQLLAERQRRERSSAPSSDREPARPGKRTVDSSSSYRRRPSLPLRAGRLFLSQPSLFDLRALAQARDHGAFEQVLARALRIGGDGDQLLHAASLHLRIALLEQALVADRHRLHLLDGRRRGAGARRRRAARRRPRRATPWRACRRGSPRRGCRCSGRSRRAGC